MNYLLITALVAAFLIGLTMHTPPQACAVDPDCATAPVNR